MWYVLIVIGMAVCAVQSIRVHRLLFSALWLAGCSALVALLLFMLGAPEVAVIELSVGAGLVTVLFVFAINIAGEEAMPLQTMLPKPLAWALLGLAGLLLGWLVLPSLAGATGSPAEPGFAMMLWKNRSLDLLLQVVLIFTGTLGVIGLLAEKNPAAGGEH